MFNVIQELTFGIQRLLQNAFSKWLLIYISTYMTIKQLIPTEGFLNSGSKPELGKYFSCSLLINSIRELLLMTNIYAIFLSFVYIICNLYVGTISQLILTLTNTVIPSLFSSNVDFFYIHRGQGINSGLGWAEVLNGNDRVEKILNTPQYFRLNYWKGLILDVQLIHKILVRPN